jgi:hypothetical protein
VLTNLHEAVPSKKGPFAWLLTKIQSSLQRPGVTTAVEFMACPATVFVLSISCLAIGLILSSLALYVSLTQVTCADSSNANLFNNLGQNILLLFSLYVLIIPFLRGARLRNEKIWFLVSLTISKVAGLLSVVVFHWKYPISTFLGFLANAAQIIATLLLVQYETGKPATVPEPSSGMNSEP